MVDTVDRATRSKIMAQVRSTDTSPEIAVRRALHANGFRFRLHRKDLPGTPDIVLPRTRDVVFVNGCFWHGHHCPRSRMPSSNRAYWKRKIRRNAARDAEVVERLRAKGWKTHVIWECDLRRGIDQLLSNLTP